MAGECSTAPHGLFIANGDVVGLYCAACGGEFLPGDYVQRMAVRAHRHERVEVLEACLAHLDCDDPACNRVTH